MWSSRLPALASRLPTVWCVMALRGAMVAHMEGPILCSIASLWSGTPACCWTTVGRVEREARGCFMRTPYPGHLARHIPFPPPPQVVPGLSLLEVTVNVRVASHLSHRSWHDVQGWRGSWQAQHPRQCWPKPGWHGRPSRWWNRGAVGTPGREWEPPRAAAPKMATRAMGQCLCHYRDRCRGRSVRMKHWPRVMVTTGNAAPLIGWASPKHCWRRVSQSRPTWPPQSLTSILHR